METLITILFVVLIGGLLFGLWSFVAISLAYRWQMKEIDAKFERNMEHLKNMEIDKISLHDDIEPFDTTYRRILYFGLIK